ncbi:MAG TPA: glycosyltransferase family A protein [Blastocatellia bacterium]|nr:glycosyltransferase family A protein [Blastocatellia bacterium]
MKKPLLSVVIPTWNRARMVCEAIESALAQHSDAVQVIVVDDGSTDDTANVVSSRFKSRVKLLQRPQRAGSGAARNDGLREANGEFLAFLDSDDLWLEGKFTAELELFERWPEAEVVVSDSVTLTDSQNSSNGIRTERSWFEKNGLSTATQGRVAYLHECPWLWGHWQNTLAMCSITLRRSVVDRLGLPLFPEDLTAGEDWELEMRLYKECRVSVLPKVLSLVRRIDDGTRPNRAVPGTALTSTQQISLLGDKLKILERTLLSGGLPEDIRVEVEHCRFITAQELGRWQQNANRNT